MPVMRPLSVLKIVRNECTRVNRKELLNYFTQKSTRQARGYSTAQKLKWSYAQGPSDTPMLGMTIGQLMQMQAEKSPDKTAVIFSTQGVRRTFAELLKEADQLAGGLMSLGLKKGDRVGVWGPNSLEWVLSQYATARAGFILVNINPAYKPDELEYAVRKVGCKALIVAEKFKDQNYYEMLFHLIPELSSTKPGAIKSHILPDLKHIIMMGDKSHPGTYNFKDIMDACTNKLQTEILDLQDHLQFDDPINIQFTSGTTGNPKGATLSHHNIVNNSYFVGRRLDYHGRDTRICMPVPLYHCFGMVIGSLCTVTVGATCVFPSPGFDPGASLQSASDERCTSLYGVPTMFIDMLNHPKFDSFDLSSLYTGIMAGSPCPIETMKQVIQRMNISEVTVCYGTTETSPVTFQCFRDDEVEKRVSTVGRPHQHTEAKVISEEGKVVPVNTPGELCTRGYTTMLGYWDDEEKTAAVIKKDKWYYSGDIAVMNEDGFVKIVGRIKDLIIRGGENVYPTEIEQVLYKHPSIKDVQVVGVPDPRLGEEICAWVQLKEGESVSEDEIKQFCRDKMARFKVPRYVSIVEGFPLTVTGKVQKYKIRDIATEQLGLSHVAP